MEWNIRKIINGIVANWNMPLQIKEKTNICKKAGA